MWQLSRQFLIKQTGYAAGAHTVYKNVRCKLAFGLRFDTKAVHWSLYCFDLSGVGSLPFMSPSPWGMSTGVAVLSPLFVLTELLAWALSFWFPLASFCRLAGDSSLGGASEVDFLFSRELFLTDSSLWSVDGQILLLSCCIL